MIASWDMDIEDINDLRFNLAYGYKTDKLDKINEKLSEWDNTYGKK